MPFRPQLRRLVHISMIGFALCIGRLSPFLIVLSALAAFLFNLWLLPRLTRHQLEKPTERHQGFALGLLLYPATLTLLGLLFWQEQVFMAIGWGAMAFGDLAAAYWGPRGNRVIRWAPQKHWRGVLAFGGFSVPLTLGLLALLPEATRLGLSWETWLLILGASMGVAALVETIPGLIDDNFSVPLSAALSAYLFSQWVQSGSFFLPTGFLLAAVVITTFSVVSTWTGKIDDAGACVGGLIAAGLYLGGGYEAMLLLLVFFAGGTLASSWGKRRKQEMELAQESGGKRSVRHALANGGIAGLLGLLAWTFPQQDILFLTGMSAAFASALGDTISSELGNLYGKRYLDLRSWQAGERGRDGVISLEGTLLGFAASLLMALIATASIPYLTWWPILLGGMVGNLADSWLGASLQRQGYMSNDTVNFANTLVGALVGIALI